MKLFEPLKIKNLNLKNRAVMPPMCMYAAFGGDGKVSPFHLAHYAARAIGQTGLVIVEATGVRPEGRISDQCLGLWEDGQTEGMARLARAIREQGAVPALQINHAGRKSLVSGHRRLGPSALPYDGRAVAYEEMTTQDIAQVLDAYRACARRANEAGFEGLEIHAAHGYLLHQFLSPLSNARKDKYGQDRALFLREAVQAVCEGWPEEKALWMRISASDWLPNSVAPGDWIRWLAELPRKMDMVHVSGGGLQKAQVHSYPGYMLPLAEEIRRGTGLPVIGVGFLDEDQLILEALESGRCDLVSLGRSLLRNPNKVVDIAWRLGLTEWVPKQYERAYRERI
ncbi:MAG: NADPH dehydrogenase [Clostridiales bacterium]|nr:NADPH dehydrogenase [Clostridiales bacterium]